MKKPVISGWVLSFGSEKALLQAVRVLVKEENLRWEVCAPYPCAAVRLANRHAREGRGSRRPAVGRSGRRLRVSGRGSVALLDAVLCGSPCDPGQGPGLGQLARICPSPV